MGKRTTVWACMTVAVLVTTGAASLGCANDDGPKPDASAPAGSATGSSAIVPGRPTAPAEAGSVLTTVPQPPESTVAMIETSAATLGSVYDVTFEPYGTGGGGLVVRVLTSKLRGSAAKPFEFSDRNVLVVGDPEVLGAVAKGGRYAGTITLRLDGGLLVPQLGGVRAGG